MAKKTTSLTEGQKSILSKLSIQERRADGFTTDFLLSNTRRDRDKVIKARAKIEILKELKNEFIQSNS